VIYHGWEGDKHLVNDDDVQRILNFREDGKIFCDQTSVDDYRCIPMGEVFEGSIYPPVDLPSTSSVFMVTSEAQVGELYRTLDAVIDRGNGNQPRVLAWRYR
jgi:hypothetical protein